MLPVNYSLAAIAESAADLTIQAEKLAEKQEPQGWLDMLRLHWASQADAGVSLSKQCKTLLDRVERIPVRFHGKTSASIPMNSNECHVKCLKAAQTAYSVLSKAKSSPLLNQLAQRIVALRYRMEIENGGCDRESSDQTLNSQLCEKASQWKRKLVLATEQELIPQEIKQLEEAASYPEFARLLLASKEIQESFFTWALRDGNGVSQFIEFPAMCAKIKSSFLAARIGRLDPQLLRLEKRSYGDHQEKMVSLPFYINNKVEYVSILDQTKEVELTNRWRLKISEIFDIFAKKNREVGDLEFFTSTGITNWNCHQLGSWNPATHSYERTDLTQKEWWKKLPSLEIVSKEILEKRLKEDIKEGEWVLCAKATRTTPDLDLDTRHGYLEVAIPSDKGSYTLYPFGVFAGVFPNSLLELIGFLADTVPGKVAYPDENFFYSHRQQAFHPMKLTPEQGQHLMQVIQKELIKAKYGHVIFQFGGENCAFWAQKVLHEADGKMPNFYRLNFVDSKPLNPVLKGVFSCIRALPSRLQMYGIAAFDRAFGSHRGRRVVEKGRWEVKSHHTSVPRNDQVIYQPGFLHQQIENGQLKGGLYFGNSCLRISLLG